MMYYLSVLAFALGIVSNNYACNDKSEIVFSVNKGGEIDFKLRRKIKKDLKRILKKNNLTSIRIKTISNYYSLGEISNEPDLSLCPCLDILSNSKKIFVSCYLGDKYILTFVYEPCGILNFVYVEDPCFPVKGTSFENQSYHKIKECN